MIQFINYRVKLDYYKEAIHQVADYMGTKEVRFWELLKKGL